MLHNAVFCDDILKRPSASGGVAPKPLPGALPLDPTGGLLQPPDPPHHFPPFSLFPSPMSDHGSILSVMFCDGPAGCLAWRKTFMLEITWQTFQPNFVIPAMLIGTINFYHFITLRDVNFSLKSGIMPFGFSLHVFLKIFLLPPSSSFISDAHGFLASNEYGCTKRNSG